MKQTVIWLIGIVIFGQNTLMAQEYLERKVTSFYKKARFEATDQDRNQKLSSAEIQRFAAEYIFFLDKKNFEKADADQDGELNVTELEAKYEGEQGMRVILEKQQLRAWTSDYLKLPLADKKYLKDNPELTEKLLGNAYWMTENPLLVKELLSEKSLWKQYPNLFITLQKNLLWLSQHPFLAQKLLDAQNTLPEMEGWKKSLATFLKENPNLKNSSYNEGK